MARPVLVIGGCGLLGFPLVQELLRKSIGPITVASRNPTINLLDGVAYMAGDIADAAFVDRVFATTKPQIVFHAASPRPVDESVKEATWRDVNVTGTQNLISSAKKHGTSIFIYSSTVNVIRGNEHVDIKENGQPYWGRNDKAIPYWKSKAEAEKEVLAANSGSLKTVALRPCMLMGCQDYALIPAQLDALKQGKTNIQLGDNSNLFDVVSANNCVEAHILTMNALLDPEKAHTVAGEAFNITDGNPLPFWDVQRIIWRTAGDTTDIKDVWVIPAWLATTMAQLSQLAYGLVFLGSKSPELNQHVVNFCTHNFTYNIDKAKRLLGYNPVPHTEDTLKEATLWELERRSKAEATS